LSEHCFLRAWFSIQENGSFVLAGGAGHGPVDAVYDL
jgi:hypothetical protein